MTDEPDLADIKATLADSLRQIWRDYDQAAVEYIQAEVPTPMDKDARFTERHERQASAIVDAVVAVLRKETA
jgi:6-phosphogluconate dehydrogenase (decarboxylating)